VPVNHGAANAAANTETAIVVQGDEGENWEFNFGGAAFGTSERQIKVVEITELSESESEV